MRPRTKLQVEVWNLHKNLSEPKEHEPFVISNHKFYYTNHYKSLVCLECNHSWKPTMKWHEEVLGVECPSCNRKLNKIETQNGGCVSRIITYSVVEVVNRFQVIRYFSCWKHMSKTGKPYYHFRSLFEEWKDWDKDKKVIVGRTQGWSGDGFSSSDYEVRATTNKWGGDPYAAFASDINCPGAVFLPRFKKYRLKNDFHNCDYRTLLYKLEMSPKVETLLKAKQKELLFQAVHKDSRHNQYWPQIKIALRNKYKIKDAGIWYDYLQLLQSARKDIRNPKFICPPNLKKEHDRLVEKNRALQRKRELERQREEVVKSEKSYQELKSRFFNLEFTDGFLVIAPLKSVQEFMEEGDILKHCVFTNKYYNKKNSLVLSARIDNKPIETIEINLEKLTIEQSRGLKNDPTNYHDQIIQLVKKNMRNIKKCMEDQTTGKQQQQSAAA